MEVNTLVAINLFVLFVTFVSIVLFIESGGKFMLNQFVLEISFITFVSLVLFVWLVILILPVPSRTPVMSSMESGPALRVGGSRIAYLKLRDSIN